MLSTNQDSCCTYTFLVVYVLTGTAGRLLPVFFPFPRCPVRHSVSKPKSVRKFKSRVGKTDKVNLQRNRRGGIRL